MKTELQITNSETFNEIILSLEQSLSKIKDVFKTENDGRKSIDSEESWKGKAQKVLSGKYELLSQNFEPIEYSIDLYIKFLRKTLEDYKLAEQSIMKNMEEMSSNLDVNS